MEFFSLDLVEFQTRLRETKAWYLSKAPVSDPAHSLRTAALAPQAGLKTPTELAWPDPPRPWSAETFRGYLERAHRDEPQIRQERYALVNEVARKRRAMLNATRFDALAMEVSQLVGRLLIYYPDQNLEDGAALTASRGFFDWDNMPPWDTWLAYIVDSHKNFQSYVIAWVPPELLELATAGIEVNPEMCITWAEEEDTEVVRQLRSAGLLP